MLDALKLYADMPETELRMRESWFYVWDVAEVGPDRFSVLYSVRGAEPYKLYSILVNETGLVMEGAECCRDVIRKSEG